MQLNHLVTVERRGNAQDEAGQARESWYSQGQAWASIRPISGREFFAASGERAEITHSMILRHGTPLQPRDRITYNGRVFDVISVMNVDERNRYLKAMATENANTGV